MTEKVDPCIPSPCGLNAQCRVKNGAAACTCIPGYVGDPYQACREQLKLECYTHADCPTTKACQSNKCVPPCTSSICGTNADCRVQNHIATCACRPGYHGDPFTNCVREPLSKFIFFVKPTNLASLAIEPIEVDPCEPNPCGSFSLPPRVVGDRCVCNCEPHMIGTPPNCRPECVVNSECPQESACITQRCQDPCPGLCGINAYCRVRNHVPICACNQGYQGDPFSRCNRITSELARSYIFLILFHQQLLPALK